MAIENLHNESFLIELLQSGNAEAFTTLYRHYSPQLYSNILGIVHDPLLAEEMVQELFTRVWEKRESAGLKENFAGYLYVTGQHLIFDFFRKLRRDRLLLQRFRSIVEKDYRHVEEGLQLRESTITLEKAVEQLSPQQKKVYHLIKQDSLSYKSAAKVMGISPFTVKEYLASTKKSIQNYFLRNTDAIILLLVYLAAPFP